jgi:hypothetical protein
MIRLINLRKNIFEIATKTKIFFSQNHNNTNNVENINKLLTNENKLLAHENTQLILISNNYGFRIFKILTVTTAIFSVVIIGLDMIIWNIVGKFIDSSDVASEITEMISNKVDLSIKNKNE